MSPAAAAIGKEVADEEVGDMTSCSPGKDGDVDDGKMDDKADFTKGGDAAEPEDESSESKSDLKVCFFLQWRLVAGRGYFYF
jgi:hypothetical protein